MQDLRIRNHASHCARLTVGEPILKIVLRLPASSDGIRSPHPLLSRRPRPGPPSIARRCRMRFCGRSFSFTYYGAHSEKSLFPSPALDFRTSGPLISEAQCTQQRAFNAFMAQLNFRQLVEMSTALSTLVPIAVADVQTACQNKVVDHIARNCASTRLRNNFWRNIEWFCPGFVAWI